MQETHPSHTRLAKPFVVLFLLLSLVIGAWLLLQYTPSHDVMKPQFTPVSAPLSQFEPYPVSIREVYETHAGYGLLFPPGSPESNRFGAKVIAPIGENIYLGIGLEATVYDGGLVAVFSASDYSLAPIPITNTHLNRIDEQGILRLYAVPDSNNLVLPGLDPTDSWAYGNVYLIDGDNRVGEKRRQNSGLTYVVHGWDVVSDPKGNLYYSSGSVVPVPFQTGYINAGEVFMSKDRGRFWERITVDPSVAVSPSDFLDGARVYGMAWFQDRLYAITHSNKIFSTKNEGSTWDELQLPDRPFRTFTSIQITNNNTLEEFLLVPNWTDNGLIKITEYDSAIIYSTPFTLDRSYNGITTDGRWIYVLGYDAVMNQSVVYRTSNLNEWYLVSTLPPFHSELGGRAYAMAYWPAKQELVVSTQGYDAQLFHLPVDSIPSSPPLPTLTPSSTPSPSPTPTPLISSLRCEECDTNRNGILEHSPPTQEDFAFIFSCMGMPYNEPPCNTANLYPDTIIDSTDFVSFINYCRPVYPNNIACADLTPTASPTDIPTPTFTDTPTPTITPTHTPTHTPTPLPDLQPPSVSILAPKQGTAVKRGTLIPINAIGEDDAGGSGLASIRIETNGTQICNAVQSPLHCTWRVPSRSGSIIRLTAVATDNAGNTNSHVVTIKSQ